MASTVFAAKKVMRAHTAQLRLLGVGADASFSLMPGYMLVGMAVENLTANAVTGNLNLGTTDAGVDVVSGFVVGASAVKHVPEASILLRYWSRSVAQALFLTSTNWNSASLNVTLLLEKVSP